MADLTDLAYLDRLVDQVDRLHAAGADADADRLFDRTLDAIDRELTLRGNVREPALFEALLLEAQQERLAELVKVKR